MVDYKKLALLRAEKYGIIEYKVIGRRMVYYSYFGSEGFYRIIHNLATKVETRKHLRYTSIPNFLLDSNGVAKYNYFRG